MNSSNSAPERNPNDIEWPFTFVFTSAKEVKAHGEAIRSLTLREPGGDDILEFGLLDSLSAHQFVPLVARLASVPESTVKMMGGRDFSALAGRLARFFSWAAVS